MTPVTLSLDCHGGITAANFTSTAMNRNKLCAGMKSQPVPRLCCEGTLCLDAYEQTAAVRMAVKWNRWRNLCVADDGFIRSFLDLLDVNEVVGDGIDGETGDAVDSEFAGDVLAMREHRVEGDEEFTRNFFV